MKLKDFSHAAVLVTRLKNIQNIRKYTKASGFVLNAVHASGVEGVWIDDDTTIDFLNILEHNTKAELARLGVKE